MLLNDKKLEEFSFLTLYSYISFSPGGHVYKKKKALV